MQQIAYNSLTLLHTEECIYFGLKKTGSLTAIWSTSPVVLLIAAPVSWAGFLNLIWQSMHTKVLFAKATQLRISSLITEGIKKWRIRIKYLGFLSIYSQIVRNSLRHFIDWGLWSLEIRFGFLTTHQGSTTDWHNLDLQSKELFSRIFFQWLLL